MNRFKCPACGGNQYTSCDTAQGCVYCGHQELQKMDTLLEPEDDEDTLAGGNCEGGGVRWRGKGL